MRAASITIVSPLARRCVASAPDVSSRSIIGTLPYSDAIASGVNASRLAASTFAPRGDEQVGGLDVVAIDGPVERRRAVELRCVDVGLLLQEPAQRGLVAFHHRVGHVALVRRAAKRWRPDHDGRYRQKR